MLKYMNSPNVNLFYSKIRSTNYCLFTLLFYKTLNMQIKYINICTISRISKKNYHSKYYYIDESNE